MGIISAPIYFETETDEHGEVFGRFLGEDFISQPIYSRQVAHITLKELKKHLDLTREAAQAVEACIEATDLPFGASPEEYLWMRIESLEEEVGNLFEVIGKLLGTDPHEKEIDHNYVGKHGAPEREPIN